MRFGLLGAGRIGRIHGLNVAARADAALVAVADASNEAASALAAGTGAHVAGIDAILADASIDAILICTPTDTHADLIEAAVSAGKAVFCEKPVDLDAQRIRRCLKQVSQTGKPLMIGFNRRFDPSFAALERRLRAGEAGAIEIVSVISRDPSPPPVEYVSRSGGLFRDMMIHDFDMARFLLAEEPVEVFALGSALVDPAIGQAGDVDTAAVLMKTASGRIAQISNSRRATYGYDQRIEVHGSKGMLRAGNIHETTVESATVAGFRADPVQNFFLERYAAAYRAELEAFIAACRGGTAARPSGLDGLKAQILADAATESARTGKPVAVALEAN
ncbi:myo-inositol 2-dehydrogenase / D-chiro-inositol 1-dehydrogenase [Bosea sp. OK403]|uniref:inositol 2-dehydrogenase n=1 Tax=Bosea sp. OK403 TaxID=1855286 RepID=UPI0008E3C1AC|nr:inositol 2-dehydrogenase [Bosea sp. OK403]SFI79828.1 myo-inositol 2-dehydrogenase / D-chiro-inositol 1-dehydrogenase [Bosea sp. OK403]